MDEFLKKINLIIKEFEVKLRSIRSYKFALHWLESVEIIAYGKKYELKSLASISQLDISKYKVTPWDVSILSDIERDLRKTNFGGSIQKEKESLIISFPPITEETKKNLLKNLSIIKEEFRIKIRRLRDDFLKDLKSEKDSKKISEDFFYKTKEKIEIEVEKANKKIEELFQNKEKEILS
ncbi:MAG: ribosome-recycling factor [Patescibacteria group bacterium]|nr:ribosome-recycling factor [Patescibacteria group bacterium]